MQAQKVLQCYNNSTCCLHGKRYRQFLSVAFTVRKNIVHVGGEFQYILCTTGIAFKTNCIFKCI